MLESQVSFLIGNFLLNILTIKPWVNLYKDVGSVVIRVHKKGIIPKDSLLINAHYDSAVGSPAASDDAVSCAIMLEVLASIVKEVDRGVYDFNTELVMLFNGAEETFLQASHGFSTQNPWAKNVKAFVNLEAAGSGGKEILFQAGPNNPWLVEEYVKSVPFPFGASVADDVFKSGIIPSDTDYKIFRDFAHIPGLDIAYITNGYIYHTTHDKSEYIPDGTIHRSGLNILALTKALLNADGLKAPLDNERATPVYFDFLGFQAFSIASETNRLVSTTLIIMVLIYIFLNQSILDTIKGLSNVIISFLSGCLISILIAGALTISPQGSMSWFSNQWVVIFLYMLPTFIGASLYHQFTRPVDINAVIKKEKQLFIGTMLVWMCLLMSLIVLDKSTSFLISLWIIGPFICRGIIGEHILPSSKKGFHIIKVYTLTAFGILLALILTINIFITFIDTIIPISGRMGNKIPSDIFLSILCSVCSLSITSYFIPLTLYIHKKVFYFVSKISTILTTVVFILAITQILFPFSMNPGSPKPKRLYLSYISRGGLIDGSMPENYIWVLAGDYLSLQPILDSKATSLDQAKIVECDKTKAIRDCPLSTFVPLYDKIAKSFYIKVEERNSVPDPILRVINTTDIGNKHKIVFSLQINYRGIMLVSKNEEVNITSWSFHGEPTEIPLADGTKIYFVHMSCGIDPCVNEFWLEFEGFQADKVNIDIGVANQWTTEKSDVLDSIIQEMPEWVDVISWQASYMTWQY